MNKYKILILCVEMLVKIVATVQIHCGIGVNGGKGSLYITTNINYTEDILIVRASKRNIEALTMTNCKCSNGCTCDPAFQPQNVTTSITNEMVNINISFYNVTKDYEGQFSVVNKNLKKPIVNKTCYFQVIEIPKEVKCHSEPMKNGLYIVQCSAQTRNKITTCIFYNGNDESPETPVITASNSQINCTLYNLTMVSEERNITFLIYANVTGHDTDTQFGTNLTYTIRKDTISTRSTAFPNNYAETTSLCAYTECIFHFSNSERICSSCIHDKNMSNIKETLSMYKLENVTATIKTDNFNLTICHESDNKFLTNTENKSYSNFTVGLYICKSDHLTQYFICNECESQRYQMKCCFHSNLTDISNRSSVEEIPQCEVYTGSKTKIILASIAVLVATSMLTLFFVKQTGMVLLL
ncbi:uncharacterized protein LOC106055306 isoform X2 [Biomphalaria glabrata]|uniref:Uncharacterized protein LOC106055306 isoform X2 n=1 Tax=Biomphalaria glabrata TaxID=6526 RepID=A0A9W2YXU7_BIOGL|nr:uncharacterized protein LOC106055306 isoform X2 [Biomphalaria glabrata]